MRTLLVWTVLVAVPAFGQRAVVGGEALSERRVSYEIDGALDPASRMLRGTALITWRNPDRVPVDEVQFHLYLNAFKSSRTTFMREGGLGFRGLGEALDPEAPDTWGWIDVLQIEQSGPGPRDVTDRLRFIRPDDGNPYDSTAAALPLPAPVAPGETIQLTVAFEARLPRIIARTGWAPRPDGRDFFMGAQWFPKLGVYEVPGQRYVPPDAPRGRWNTHQYHARGEFYADFGTYSVTLDVPADYAVGATGVRVGEAVRGDRRRLTYRAEDVHDFAWAAGDGLVEAEDQWRHVRLRLLLQPEHAAQAARHFAAAKVALDYYGRWIGPYPYPVLTLVDAVGEANGMEYPTLITCGTVYALPPWVRALEAVTIHEFGHQYFYGLLANHEAEEAWLDEGINSYLEARIMDAAYGPGSVLDLPGLQVSAAAFQHLRYAKQAPGRGRIVRRAWEHPVPSDYGKLAYSKPATVLRTLEGLLGWPTMQQILQTYVARWRFRHPTTRDFIAVAEAVSGQDLGWFFDQFLYDDVAVDYAIRAMEAEEEAPGTYLGIIDVERREAGVVPQALRLRFADGHVRDLAWDGRARARRFTVRHTAPLAEAVLDPDRRCALDIHRLNNGRTLAADGRLARREQLKLITRLQQLLMLVR